MSGLTQAGIYSQHSELPPVATMAGPAVSWTRTRAETCDTTCVFLLLRKIWDRHDVVQVSECNKLGRSLWELSYPWQAVFPSNHWTRHSVPKYDQQPSKSSSFFHRSLPSPVSSCTYLLLFVVAIFTVLDRIELSCAHGPWCSIALLATELRERQGIGKAILREDQYINRQRIYDCSLSWNEPTPLEFSQLIFSNNFKGTRSTRSLITGSLTQNHKPALPSTNPIFFRLHMN